jgi:hypothetical protein
MSVTTIPLLDDLQGAWANLQIELVGVGPIQLPGIYPFISVTDLKRLLWNQQEGNPRWAPERVFIGVRSVSGIRPIEFHWPASVTGGSVDLPDPLLQKEPNPALIDEMGNRRPIGPTMIGSLILETALSPELIATGAIPVITAISLADLPPSSPEALTSALYGGFYQLYFPWLTAPGQVLDASQPTTSMNEAYSATVAYSRDRDARIRVVQRALMKKAGGTSVSMNTMTRLRWTLPPPAQKPESLERTFYGLHATATIPFLRYFSVGRSPLLKLALKPDGTPFLDDDKIFAQYLNQPVPILKSGGGIILAKIPLASAHVERGAAFTLFMFEDGTCDIGLEVPQRGATYVAAVAADAQRILQSVVTSIGFPEGTVPALHDLHATYKWTHPDSRRSAPLSMERLYQRVAALTPFLDPVPLLPDEKALAVFQWRAVSNYESETAQFAYITQMILRSGPGPTGGEEGLSQYTAELADKFGVTQTAAAAILERWAERRADAVAPAIGPGAGSLAVPKHSTGASVAIQGAHPEYMLEIQGVDTIEELQRLVSVVGVLLGASKTDLAIAPPEPVEQAAALAIAIENANMEDAATAAGPPEEDVDLGEMDPAMAALMADLGFGLAESNEGNEDEEGPTLNTTTAPSLVIEEVVQPLGPPVAAPNLEAVVAAVEEECRGTPWAPGESALKISPDYYMAKLKKEDKILFGYSSMATGRVKTYSKSCQRRDDRQPNIMTLAEYARVKRCYEDKVRFVDLPPRRASDLPQDPTWNPKRNVEDDYYFTDHTPGPTFGLPLWSVYGYENKTRPGEFLYVVCAELWCERDNLPILRSEFEGTQGRGFTKPPRTCPFCAGRPFANLAKPESGESVIVRNPKESTGKLHRYIGTIKHNKHPSGYPLPCCDTTPRLLEKYLKAAFLGQLEFGRDLAVEEEEGGVPEDAEVAAPPPELELDAGTGGEEGRIDYRQRLGSMHTQYILGNDKALEAGKIGLLPPLLDAFFGQNGPRALESRGIRPTFSEGATVFVRIGVDTRIRTPGLNLFAGLAPLMGFESAEECQRHVLTRRMVRGFESANYGTLVQEFAAKATVTEEELTKSLPDFAGEFGYKLDTNRAHVVRLYKAWTAFLAAMADNKTPKKLRHLEHMLAQPGTVTNRGLLLVVLEQTGSKIDVVCPSFGIPMASIFGDVPIAFLWHDKRDESWEPIVLYNGTKDAVRFFGERSPELEVIPAPLRTALQQWLRDWRSSSLGCGRPAPPPHVWTPDRSTTDLPRLTQLRARMEGVNATALVRDRSNRLAGLLLTVAVNQMFVPCLDDGSLAEQLPRVFEADSIPLVPVDAYLKFYATLATQYPGLTPTKLLAKMEQSDQVIGFMTAVGSMIPTAPSTASTSDLPVQQMDAFPWERDALILRPADAISLVGSVLEESTASVEEQLAEAYQYLRLSLSNWLIRDARGPAMRASLAKLLISNIPLYEKRKRMDIALEPLIREWVSVEITEERRSLSLLRQDCLSLDSATCAEAEGCRWISEATNGVANGAGQGDRCLIHAPSRESGTDPVRIFTAKLSDELLRYSAERHEILDQKVQAIRTPRGAVRVGDELFMATKPKESGAAILERLGFMGHAAVAFPEEMMRFEGLEEEEERPMVSALDSTTLPTSWSTKGFRVPTPPPEIDDANRLAFAEGTGRPMEKWEEYVKDRRTKLGLPDVPFQWSQQDFYVIASLTLSNILFVSQEPSGQIKLDTWIQPPSTTSTTVDKNIYMIFWGPRELLVTKGGKLYRFYQKDLPEDLLTAMDGASPVPEEEARGSAESVTPAVQEQVPVVPVVPVVQEVVPVPSPVPTTPDQMKLDLETLNKTGDMEDESDQQAREVLRKMKWVLPETLQQRYNGIVADIENLEGDSLNNAVDELKELYEDYAGLTVQEEEKPVAPVVPVVQEEKPVVQEGEKPVVQEEEKPVVQEEENPVVQPVVQEEKTLEAAVVQSNAEKVVAPLVKSAISTVAAASEQVAVAAQNLTKLLTEPPKET